jgi:hypothetical protein
LPVVLLLAASVGPAAGVPAATTAASDGGGAEPAPAVEGLYPLWEQTGTLEAPRAARVGWAHAGVGLGPVAIRTQPFLALYGTLNLSAKVALLRRPGLRLALLGGWYALPAAAESRPVGNLHAPAFANPFAPITLFPVALAGTVLASRRLHVHASASLLAVRSPEAAYRSVSAGVAAFAEWFASERWSARLHAGHTGWPVWPQTHVGISFGWRVRHLALAAGYARRFDPGETSRGLVMLDGALLFP